VSEKHAIRVLSVDDHPLFREGIAAVIKSQPDMLLAGEASSAAEAMQRFRELDPDVTLMGLRLPDLSGIEATIQFLKHFTEARVILVSTYDSDIDAHEAIQAGAWGHILKTMPTREMVEIVRRVCAGKKCLAAPAAAQPACRTGITGLTAREVEAFAQAAGGTRGRNISQRLFISEDRVKSQLKQIMEKLDARDRTVALNVAARRGFIRP
jgi:DNA-binding NarL/FixJ family response regulator